MSYKFKKGQLVEIVKSAKGKNVGARFEITDRSDKIFSTGGNLVKGSPSYKTNILNGDKVSWAPEEWLRAVNPDNDESSEFTFEDLMLGLKQGVTV